MRRAIIFLAVVVLLASASVQAQKKSPQPISAPPIVEPTQILIQDDEGGGSLIIDLASGECKVNLCEYGYQTSGFGEVKIDGCTVYFSLIQKRYRVFATAYMCDHRATCAVEIFELSPEHFQGGPILEYWTDKDMNNNTAECGGPTAKTDPRP